MPRPKREIVSDDEGYESDEVPIKSKSSSKGKLKREASVGDEDEEGEEEFVPRSKKSRPSNGNAQSGGIEVERNDDGDPFFKLSEYRRATVRTFKGKVLIDLREMYKDKSSGEMKPGAKGLSLTVEQWEVLRANIGTIDKLVEAKSKGK